MYIQGEIIMDNIKFLTLLSKEYPNIESASAAIINMNALLNLPKGTEYFFSDLHGEHDAFNHLLKSASGMIRNKIDEMFAMTVAENERNELALLIYYPREQVERLKETNQYNNEWFKITTYRLLQLANELAEKFTRNSMRRRLPAAFAYSIEELLHAIDAGKFEYYTEIAASIYTEGLSERFIVVLSDFIRRLSVDKLHIIGDIFDRGPRADKIMSELQQVAEVDIQWGNHDISWIGAASGNKACIANVIRIGTSYNNFDLLEDAYGINLRPLSTFAASVYGDDPCKQFMPHVLDENKFDAVEVSLAAKMHKAIAVIQYKLEGALIRKHPEYQMEERNVLSFVNFEKGTFYYNGKTYPLNDTNFPTIDPDDPLKLTDGEESLMNTLTASFRHSDRLQRDIKFLFAKGAMYKSINNNLLYHGCIPLTDDGEFEEVELFGQKVSGKSYLDLIDKVVRSAYLSNKNEPHRQNYIDFCWYLWCGPKSPLFGKNKMTSFERYFIDDKETHVEERNPYYTHMDDPVICARILKEFGLDPIYSHIINGHVPVKPGENPIKANGMLYVIDGGISKAYQSTTGIGGYTLIYNSRYLALAEHKPFSTDMSGKPQDHTPKVQIAKQMPHRILVKHTDYGKELLTLIEELTELIAAYKQGIIKEKM